MRALSLLQPWASLVVSGSKNIENRRWHLPKAMHGQRFLVHASARLDKREIESARATLERVNADTGQTLQMPQELPLGGIIGIARATSCLCPSEAAADAQIHYPWWFGDQHGFMLDDRAPLPFIMCKGALGFWTVPDAVLGQLGLVVTDGPNIRLSSRKFALPVDEAAWNETGIICSKRRCNNLIANGSRCSVLLDATDPRVACDICLKGAAAHV